MKDKVLLIAALLPSLVSSQAFAHAEGDHAHGFIDGMLHTLSSGDHVLMAGAAGVLFALGVAVLRKKNRQRSESRFTASSGTPDTPASRQTP